MYYISFQTTHGAKIRHLQDEVGTSWALEQLPHVPGSREDLREYLTGLSRGHLK